MKKLLMSLLKLIPLKQALEIILKFLTDEARNSPAKWDDEVMKYAWMLYDLLGYKIPEHLKSKYSKLGIKFTDTEVA